MFTKVLKFSAAMLLLASFSVVSADSMKVDCGDMSTSDCRMKTMTEMDKMMKTKFIEMMKAHMMKTIDFFADVKNDLPADGTHVKVITQSIDDMRKEMMMLDKMDGMKMEEMVETIKRAFLSMQPNFTQAQLEDPAKAENFSQVLEKHGYNVDGIAEGVLKMVKEFEKMWMEMYSGLRPQDMNDYPQYAEMNDMVKNMMETTSKTDQIKMYVEVIRKMVELNETEFMKTLTNLLKP